MRGLSNLLGLRDGSGAQGPIDCRRAHSHEIEPALRLLLCGPAGLANDEQVLDFISLAKDRAIDLNELWLAHRNGTILWTLLPVISPGKTMLLFTPGRITRHTPFDAVANLVHAIGEHYRHEDVDLAQFLIDPAERGIAALYEKCGFISLAELLYLQRTLRRPAPRPELPAGFSVINYSPDAHNLFADAISRSYQQSLDCPALNGLRNIEDVIAGHQSTGEFRPELWFLLLEHDQPLAVLLLSPSAQPSTLELVYLGLAVEARGRGLGDLMMKLALAAVSERQDATLSLAVDSRNQPAMNLYFRHGLTRIASRLAMIKDLRRTN